MKLYEKQKVIGKGSYGKAYLVKSTVNHRNYVIKAITTSDSAKSVSEKISSTFLRVVFPKDQEICKQIGKNKFDYFSERRQQQMARRNKDFAGLQAHQRHQVQRLFYNQSRVRIQRGRHDGLHRDGIRRFWRPRQPHQTSARRDQRPLCGVTSPQLAGAIVIGSPIFAYQSSSYAQRHQAAKHFHDQYSSAQAGRFWGVENTQPWH